MMSEPNLPTAELFAPVSVYPGVDRVACPPHGEPRGSNAAPDQRASSPVIFIVEKCSTPGWKKEFPSLAAALTELRSHICDDCLASIGRYVGGEVTREPPPNPFSTDELLGTPCGCEFEVHTP